MDLREPDLRPVIRTLAIAAIAAIAIAVAGAATARAEPARMVGDGLAVVTWRHGPGVLAYTPVVTSAGARLRWANSCVFLRPHVDGAADLPDDTEWTILAAAADAWSAAGAACGYLQWRMEAPEAGDVALDYVNRVIMRETTWGHDASALALTTVYFVDRPGQPDDGTIVDADIELNAVDYALAACDGTPGGCVTTGSGLATDLGNVLTHELGHLVGLDHTCWSGAGPAPLDDTGAPIPPCSPPGNLSAEIRDATMYAFSAPEETKKRTPEADDIDGWCGLYPAASDPMVCAPVEPPVMMTPDARVVVDARRVDAGGAGGADAVRPPADGDGGGCGCRGGGDGGGAAGALVLAGLMAWATRRRRDGSDRVPGSALAETARRW